MTWLKSPSPYTLFPGSTSLMILLFLTQPLCPSVVQRNGEWELWSVHKHFVSATPSSSYSSPTPRQVNPMGYSPSLTSPTQVVPTGCSTSRTAPVQILLPCKLHTGTQTLVSWDGKKVSSSKHVPSTQWPLITWYETQFMAHEEFLLLSHAFCTRGRTQVINFHSSTNNQP